MLKLSYIWRAISDRPYNSRDAERLVLQVPVVTLRTDTVSNGSGNIYVSTKGSKDMYHSLLDAIKRTDAVHRKEVVDNSAILRDCVNLATTTKEKDLLKYVAASVTNVSRREATNCLGISFGRGNSRSVRVQEALQQVKILKEENLKKMRSELAERIGYESEEEFSDGLSDSDYSISTDDESNASSSDGASDGETDMREELSAFCLEENSETDGEKKSTGEVRYDNFPPISCSPTFIVVNDENDFPKKDDQMVDKDRLRQSIVDKWRARTRTQIESMQILYRKRGKQCREISRRHPDIGKVMEEYAELCDVGADKWRRTGVLTFSGEKKREKRLTYRRMQKFLETYYR